MAKQTIFGEKETVIRNKDIIKSGRIKFYQAPDHTPQSIIEEIENVYHRNKFYCMFSGGKDSMTAAHLLDSMGKLESIVHIQTHIGLQMSTDFVKEVCEKMGWKLRIIHPNPMFGYVAYALQYGCPDPRTHRFLMGKIKFKPMRDFALSVDRKNHCLITGIRKFESDRRMGNYLGPIQSNDALWFGNPIFYMSSEDTYKYVHEHGLKISPAYDLGFGTSGECMCGSYATKGLKMKIREHDPKLAEFMEWIETGIEKFGTDKARKYGKWGMQTKMTDLEHQQYMTEFFKDNKDMDIVDWC